MIRRSLTAVVLVAVMFVLTVTAVYAETLYIPLLAERNGPFQGFQIATTPYTSSSGCVEVAPLDAVTSGPTQGQCLASGTSYLSLHLDRQDADIVFQFDESSGQTAAMQIVGGEPSFDTVAIEPMNFMLEESSENSPFEVVGPHVLTINSESAFYSLDTSEDVVSTAADGFGFLDQLLFIRKLAKWNHFHPKGWEHTFDPGTLVVRASDRTQSSPFAECVPVNHNGPYRGILGSKFTVGPEIGLRPGVWLHVYWAHAEDGIPSTFLCMGGSLGYVWLPMEELLDPQFATFKQTIDQEVVPPLLSVTLPEPVAVYGGKAVDTVGWVMAGAGTVKLILGYVEQAVFKPVTGGIMLLPGWEFVCSQVSPGLFPECIPQQKTPSR